MLQAGAVYFLNRRDHTQATACQPGPPMISLLRTLSSQRTTEFLESVIDYSLTFQVPSSYVST